MKGPRLSFILISLLFLFIVSMHVHLVRGKEEKDKNYALHEFRSFSKDGLREKVSCQKEEPPSKKKRKISLSEATLEDILSVDGFGPKLADKVFRRVRSYDGELTEEDVLGIPGVGESRLSALKEHFIIPETESEAEEAG
ncbi:MAG: hypothetical protein JW928_00285, partial [Candidatus Aureabacteria bacterium]|nr:hypothetical protein [Candidatus Auribacterota bacterium]